MGSWGQTRPNSRLPANDIQAELQRGARIEGLRRIVVSFSITFTFAEVYGRARRPNVTVDLYRDHGQRPSLVLEEIERMGDPERAFQAMVERRQGVQNVGNIVRVEMLLTERRPD